MSDWMLTVSDRADKEKPPGTELPAAELDQIGAPQPLTK